MVGIHRHFPLLFPQNALGLLKSLKQADRDLLLSDAFRSRAAAGGAGGGGKRGAAARRPVAHFSGNAEGGVGSGVDYFGEGDDDDADMLLARAASMLT